MKKIFSLVLVLSLAMAGWVYFRTKTPPPASEQTPGSVQQETNTPEPAPVTPEDSKQDDPAPTPSVEPTPAPTPSVDPTPEVTPSVEPTPEVEKQSEPEPTPSVEPAPKQTKEPESSPTPEVVAPAPTPSVEPTPTPDTTVEINGGSTTMPTPTPESEVEVTGTSWVEGQRHTREDVKVGATVIRADGTKVVLTETKVGDLTILGYGQGVDPYSGLTLANGSTAKEGTASWYDNRPWIKDEITGSMHSTAEWNAIESATFPGREKGSYEGEVRNTYWKWSNEMYEWMWIGPVW